jgi:hypothetical protein
MYVFGSVNDDRALLPYAIRHTPNYQNNMLPEFTCTCQCIITYTVFKTNFGWHFLYLTNCGYALFCIL